MPGLFAATMPLATLENVTGLRPESKSNYRGRLAPSPTGYLHVGHARTFWTAFVRARDAGGKLIMRVEDLDPDRSKKEYADVAMEDLRWLGMTWDDGPDMSHDAGGPSAPYVQSERHLLYRAAWQKLLAGGWVYPCRCSRKDLAAALSAPHEGNLLAPDPLDDEPIYPGTCRALRAADSGTRALAEENSNWRFRVPDGEAIEFFDLNLGQQRFIAGVDFGDFVVWRRDGIASYQLACVVDDAAMHITEVVRGADLLKSTARQILLNRALGYGDPAWFHCGLITDENGQRLAKRHDSLSIRALRDRGLTPQDILRGALSALR